MRPTPLTFFQILPRAGLDKKVQATVIPSLNSLIKASAAGKKESRTVVDELLLRKGREARAAEDQWPANLRIEPIVRKEDLKRVHADVRKRMKELILREA